MRNAMATGHVGAARIDAVHEIVFLHVGNERAGQRDGAGIVDEDVDAAKGRDGLVDRGCQLIFVAQIAEDRQCLAAGLFDLFSRAVDRSEEHTSELQSLMRISYAVFCLKKKNTLN